MRAVNLIPEELRPRVPGDGDPRVAYGVLGALAALLLMVIVSIHFANKLHTIEDQTASITAETQSHRASVATVSTTPDQIAADVKTRTLLVGGLAKTRFPWGDALYDLSRAIPSDTTLNAITVSSGSSSTTTSGSDASSNGANMELTGCTSSWVGYSRFMTWLKTMPGVDKVESTSSSVASAAGDAAVGDRTKNCGPAPLGFALSVKYSPRKIDLLGLPKPDASAAGASGATGAAPAAGDPASATTPTPAPAPTTGAP